jgi:predicted lipoprotein with Yx(FWY)xxD motif
MKKTAVAAIGAIVLCGWAMTALAEDRTEVRVAAKEGVGSYLADADGKSLYWFTKDSPGKSACAGPCLAKWPLFYREIKAVPEPLKAADFGSIKRDDGGEQTTFRGYPLYYWSGDASAGDTKGQGLNGVWFLIDPASFPPKKAAW